MLPSPVDGLSSIIGAHPRQAPPVKPAAVVQGLRAAPGLCFFGSHFGLRPQGLQLVLCCLMQRAPVPVPVLPMLLLYAILWRLRGSSVVLHDRVIATPAEPRLPRWVTLQPQQEPAPRRLLPGSSGSLLCNPAAGRHCCLALGCLLQQNTLMLTASSTVGHISAALAAIVAGCLLLKLRVQRLQALPHRHRHINNGHIGTAAY